MERLRRNLRLEGIPAIAVFMILRKCGHFFNGHSPFFFSHRLESVRGIHRVFPDSDPSRQHRLLISVILSSFLKSVFDLSPLGWNPCLPPGLLGNLQPVREKLSKALIPGYGWFHLLEVPAVSEIWGMGAK